jgi:hypothetical protein
MPPCINNNKNIMYYTSLNWHKDLRFSVDYNLLYSGVIAFLTSYDVSDEEVIQWLCILGCRCDSGCRSIRRIIILCKGYINEREFDT